MILQLPRRFTDWRQFNEWHCVGLILLIGLLLRLGVLALFYADLDADPDIYLAIAKGLAEGRGYSSPGTTEPTAFRPPLYPLLLTFVSGPDQQFGRATLQLILSLATIPFVWLTGRNLGLPKSGRLFAITFVAIDPLLLRYVPYPMTETTCAFLISVLLWCLTLPGPATLSKGFLTGVVFGLTVLSRPTFWAFGFLFFVASIWNCLRDRKQSSSFATGFANSGNLGYFAACGFGIAICVLPWVMRNAYVIGTPILMTTHGGYTLLLGNNQSFYEEVVNQPFGTIWDGSHGEGQEAWAHRLQEELTAQEIFGEVERDRWMSHQAWDTIRNHPKTFIKACAIKFCWFWNVAPHSSASHSLPYLLRLGVGLYYGVLWILLTIGICVAARRIFKYGKMFRSWQAPLLLVVAMSLAHLMYWSDGRMRAPIMPAIALLAALAISAQTQNQPDRNDGPLPSN